MQLTGYELGGGHSLDATFAALADPTRRAILARLAEGERTVMELAEPFSLSQPAISKHLKVLERAHLISRDRDAQRRPSRLEAAPLAEASQWLERYREFWETSFRRLDDLLSSLQQPRQTTGHHRASTRQTASAPRAADAGEKRQRGPVNRKTPPTRATGTVTSRTVHSRGKRR